MALRGTGALTVAASPAKRARRVCAEALHHARVWRGLGVGAQRDQVALGDAATDLFVVEDLDLDFG